MVILQKTVGLSIDKSLKLVCYNRKHLHAISLKMMFETVLLTVLLSTAYMNTPQHPYVSSRIIISIMGSAAPRIETLAAG